MGVDSFYLRENGETCAIAADLKPYQDAGILDLDVIPGPKHPTQTNWYNECAKKASKKHSWVAFIDLDEFMIVVKKCAQPPRLLSAARLRPVVVDDGASAPGFGSGWQQCRALPRGFALPTALPPTVRLVSCCCTLILISVAIRGTSADVPQRPERSEEPLGFQR